MAPFDMLWVPFQFIFSTPFGTLLIIGLAIGVARLMLWREMMLEKHPQAKASLRQNWTLTIILAALLVLSGCAYVVARLPWGIEVGHKLNPDATTGPPVIEQIHQGNRTE